MHHAMESGWCVDCGMRRGADGRCANCDPWWTHPMLQHGGMAVLLAVIGTIVMITLGKAKERDFEEAARSGGSGSVSRPRQGWSPAGGSNENSALPGFGGSFPSSSAPVSIYAPPQVSAPVQMAVGGYRMSDEERALADLSALRGAVYDANTAARTRLEFVNAWERRNNIGRRQDYSVSQ